MKRFLLGVALAASAFTVSAQWSDFGNPTVIPGTNFLGSINNAPLDVITNDIRRFTLLPDATYTIGSYASQVRNGALLLSPDVDGFYAAGGPGPFSMLHLAGVGNNVQAAPARPWMRNGITFTGNSDQGYVGQKCALTIGGAEIADKTDMVAQWSSDPAGEYGPDRHRHIFTAGNITGVSSGWHSTEGLEAMRMTPIDSSHVNVGIRDFYAGNLVDPTNIIEPTERLDVLNGKVRVRQLPTDPTSASNEFVTVNTTTGVLEHRPLPPAAIANCEWSRNIPNRFVLSGSAPAVVGSTCPDRGWLYGIGKPTSHPGFKLDIEHNELDRVGQSGGLNMRYRVKDATTRSITGLSTTLDPAETYVPNGFGVYATVKSPGSTGTGTLGRVLVDRSGATVGTAQGAVGRIDASAGTLTAGHGVNGQVILGPGATVVTGAAVYGLSSGSSVVTNNYGVFGKSAFTGGSAGSAHGVCRIECHGRNHRNELWLKGKFVRVSGHHHS